LERTGTPCTQALCLQQVCVGRSTRVVRSGLRSTISTPHSSGFASLDFEPFTEPSKKQLEKDIEYYDEYDDEDFWEDEGINQEEYIKEMKFDCDCIRKWLSIDAL
jgi:hypothetical protein